jgi:hypothetical protein
VVAAAIDIVDREDRGEAMKPITSARRDGQLAQISDSNVHA